jgi:ABC-type antimicrobial peptide transport system permease subunit
MLFRESGKMLLAGLLVGTLITFSVATLVSKMLFELKPYDPVALAAAIVLLLVVGLLATLAPALRAARINPTAALREE